MPLQGVGLILAAGGLFSKQIFEPQDLCLPYIYDEELEGGGHIRVVFISPGLAGRLGLCAEDLLQERVSE